MKRGKRRRKHLPGPAIHHPAPVRDRRIVPVDDAPLRQRAASDCNKAMAKLEKARAELRSFEREDRPAYGQWMSATFGALLTEIRENARLVQERETLIQEVELEMMLSGHRNARKAYAAVMKRRENPVEVDPYPGADQAREESGSGPADADGGEWDDEDADFGAAGEMGADVPEKERRALFESFVREVLNFDPREMSRGEYARMFAEFDAEMFGMGRQAERPRARGAKAPRETGDEARLKETYRNLVRRLHPDLRADGDATVSAIWHEVQEAYEARNLDRLETLLALTEMENGTSGGKASLSHMHGALAELNRALRAIQRSLQGAKRDPAWGFSRNPYRGPMEKRVRRETEEILDGQRWVLADMKRIIDDFSRPWSPPVRKPRRQIRQAAGAGAERPGQGSSIPMAVQGEFFDF